ncbi:MAG: molybdopterin-dependent oxidoreductase [Granulosicoccus sp.]
MSQRCRSVCPHDCPSVCALDVEVLNNTTIGKVYGVKDHSYTRGIVCAKVSRYAERIHHPNRLTDPLLKQDGSWVAISWDEALDTIAEQFERIRQRSGSEAVWPYHYAGTMGLVQRDGLDRFRHAYATSRQHSTFCTALSDAGFMAGIGIKRGSDARLMEKSELIVIWGGNPVSTQVNVMHHVAQAKRENNASVVVVDPYRTKTAEKADIHLMLKPGTDAALACAVMHVLLEEGYADEAYMHEYTDVSDSFRMHIKTRTPGWAAGITGLSVDEIVRFARLYGQSKKSFLRLGYGFSRSRNGAVNMHAATCLPAITGAWQYEGGGALYSNGSIYDLDSTNIKGENIPCSTRIIDQSRIGQVLTGNAADLQGGPPIEALFVQNTNPAVVAPETRKVLQGLAREDLFTVVHEQFMTETAACANLVLPATMFLEHDDIYKAGGHTHLQIGQKLIEPPGHCKSNHQVLQALASRLGLEHPGFHMSERDLIEDMLKSSGLPDFNTVLANGGHDCAPLEDFAGSNHLNGFGTADGKFHFCPDWHLIGDNSKGMPAFPDHWDVTENANASCPLRLVAAPARQFLNTSFTETESSRRMEKKPLLRIHPQDALRYGLGDGTMATIGNDRGEVTLQTMNFDGVQQGTVVVESLWPNNCFTGGLGINTLISSEPGKPAGGAVFHDTAVWVKPYSELA